MPHHSLPGVADLSIKGRFEGHMSASWPFRFRRWQRRCNAIDPPLVSENDGAQITNLIYPLPFQVLIENTREVREVEIQEIGTPNIVEREPLSI